MLVIRIGEFGSNALDGLSSGHRRNLAWTTNRPQLEGDKKDDDFGKPRSERAQQFLSKILQH